jgi:lipopolysaccharide export system permease protein
LRTLDRYIFREVASTWVAVSGVLLIILLSLQLSRVLSQAAANGFPREAVLSLIGLTSTGYLPVVVPIGFFLAIMLGLGRLYHESEMAAIQSCGVGPGGLYRPIAVLGVIVAALLVWLGFSVIPQAMTRVQEIREEALRNAQFGTLEPGRFRTFGGGNVVFYAERVDDNRVLHNVNVFVDRPSEDGKKDSTLEIWVAARAQQRGAGQAEQTFVLYDGRRYEGIPGQGEFRIVSFSEGGIPIRLGELRKTSGSPQAKPTSELFRSSDRADAAELGARLSAPVMVLVLMLLAVPLSRLRPRQGRFGKLGIGILAYFIYALLLDAGRTWIENGIMPVAIGVWWVHAIVASAGLWLLVRENPPGRAKVVAAGA